LEGEGGEESSAWGEQKQEVKKSAQWILRLGRIVRNARGNIDLHRRRRPERK